MKKNIEKNHEKIIWHAPEFEYIHKDIVWYWLSVIAASVLFLIALWQQNLLFAIFIVISEVLFMHWAREYPKTMRFTINKKGVEIGDADFLEYSHLSGFHIIHRNDHGELIIKTKNRIQPFTKIIVLTEDIPEITEFLKKHLSQIDYEESMVDHFERMIGF